MHKVLHPLERHLRAWCLRLRTSGSNRNLKVQLRKVNPHPAHSAIAANRLNGPRGEQRTVEVSGAELSRTSTSANPAATSADNGSFAQALVAADECV
jgi:hypothetical protein